jgi:arginase
MKPADQDIPINSICILGIGLDTHSSYLKGASLAPSAIREGYFSRSSNRWTEFGMDLESLKNLTDLGDIDFPDNTNHFNRITGTVSDVLSRNNRLVCIGGDHAVTYPVIKAFSNYFQPLTILHLDAHPDLYDCLDNDPYSHACPFARIMEKGLAKRLIQAGIRTMNGHQKTQAEKFGVEVHEMKDGLSWVKTLAVEGPVYISIDLDCLDPGFAPGVSHYEPGGMSTRDVISILHSLKGCIIGADIVEYNPLRDINQMTAMVAAKLLKETICRISRDWDK